MERLFFECAVRAALLVGGTAIVLYAMRVKAAAARHSVWASVVALMLVLPVWTTWGPKAPLRLLPPLAPNAANQAMVPASHLSTLFLASPLVSTWQAVFLGVYLVGLCLLLLRLAMGTAHARRLVRNAVLHNGVRTSPLCAAPVTVGFFRPTVIFPEHWREWPRAQLDAVLTHEGAHVRRRDPLVQWLALLNRALFWFHPAAWWLERQISALAEEACDNVVLARGHSPQEYAECLVDMARSVARSGSRLKLAGMAMPGSFLPQRIGQIMEGGHAPHISQTRMACVVAACAITCTAFAAGTLDHARQDSPSQTVKPLQKTPSAAHPAVKFVLGDLKIEGDVHDRDGVRDRVLKAWKDREYDDIKELASAVMEVGIRGDLQERGYFKVVVGDPLSKLLSSSSGKQRVLLVTAVTEGDQFRLGTLTIIQSVPSDRALSIPTATLREQFHLRKEDLFNVSEIRTGLERLQQLYTTHGYPNFTAEPDTEIDSASHHINVILRVNEGPHTL